MTRSRFTRFGQGFGLAACSALTAFVPSIALACPMCFNGDNTNAFVYGSLFLMLVPTITLGSLGYWAYRRIKAQDEPPHEAAVPHVAVPSLRVLPRQE
jgi:hypothetical protein